MGLYDDPGRSRRPEKPGAERGQSPHPARRSGRYPKSQGLHAAAYGSSATSVSAFGIINLTDSNAGVESSYISGWFLWNIAYYRLGPLLRCGFFIVVDTSQHQTHTQTLFMPSGTSTTNRQGRQEHSNRQVQWVDLALRRRQEQQWNKSPVNP
ncbi:hypothetical protein PG991_007069 [Apiospora marii]|uniref:Uncharacterized protein n=1 Tax=Apiospora marii TaxID=335849 RepID=A0ABR1RZ99_9PEZI